jgi:hypothetical protein
VLPIQPVHPQFTVTDARDLKHPDCGRCGNAMWLMGIQPDKIGRQIRTFECADCGRTASVSVSMTQSGGAKDDVAAPSDDH